MSDTEDKVMDALAAAGEWGLTGSEASKTAGVLLNTARVILHSAERGNRATISGKRPNERGRPEAVYVLL